MYQKLVQMEEMNGLFSRLVKFAEENDPDFRLYDDYARAAANTFNRLLPALSQEDQGEAIAAIKEDRDLTVYYVVCRPSIAEYNRVQQNYAEIKSYFLNYVTISNRRESGIKAINFGLTEGQLGSLYEGLVDIGNLDNQTSKEDFVNIHLGRPSAERITFLRGGKGSSVMPLIVEMYFQLGVFVTVNRGEVGMANISEDFQPFLQAHYTNTLTSLRNQEGQFKSGATQKAKAIIMLINTIKNITN